VGDARCESPFSFSFSFDSPGLVLIGRVGWDVCDQKKELRFR